MRAQVVEGIPKMIHDIQRAEMTSTAMGSKSCFKSKGNFACSAALTVKVVGCAVRASTVQQVEVPVPKGKHEPASDVDTAVVDSLKALDPKRPIREADIGQSLTANRKTALGGGHAEISCAHKSAVRVVQSCKSGTDHPSSRN